jgi:(p)ppGpp synthase/HD superfamily hydrolase
MTLKEYRSLSSIQRAEELSRLGHARQTRRDGTTPYIRHIEAVVARLNTVDLKVIGWLHDVVEDGHLTFKDLQEAGIPDYIILPLRLLTHDKGVSYDEYIIRMTESPHADKVVPIKVADILANLSDTPTPKQVAKYTKALGTLLPYYIDGLKSIR